MTMNTHHDDEIDLSELFAVLWHRKWFIIVFTVLTTLLAAVYIYQMPSIYQSNVLVMSKSSSTSADPIQSLVTGAVTSVDNTETELELIKSKGFAAQIVDNLTLYEHPEFKIAVPEKTTMLIEELAGYRRQNAIKKVSSNISVSQKSDTNLITISYRSYDPYLAARIADEIGETFIVFKEELMEGEQKSASELIQDKLEGVQDNLRRSEQKIVDYQNKHDFVDIRAAISLGNSKLAKISAEKYEIQKDIERAGVLKRNIKEYRGDVEALLNLPGVANSSLVSGSRIEFKKKKQLFEQVKQRYGPKHPKYMEAARLFDSAEESLKFELADQVNKLNKSLELQNSNLNILNEEIANTNERLKKLAIIQFDYQKLTRDFEANLELYEALVKKLNESEMMQDLSKTSNTILLESAEVNNIPVKPNRKLMIVLAIMLSIVVAVLIVFIEVMVGDKLVQYRKVASKYGTRVIGAVPKIKLKGRKKDVITQLDTEKHRGYIEAVRSIRTSILLDKKLSKQKVIAITSISPNDGKSSLSIQLAKSFSELEEVILVDADLRFPSIANALGEEEGRPGLTNLIAKSHSVDNTIFKPTDGKYSVLPSGAVPKNPLLFLSNERLKKAVQYLKGKYERVIMECPPIMSVSDAFIISKHVDSVFLVVDCEKTNKVALENVLDELRQADVHVGGILINKIKKSNNYYANNYYARGARNEKGVKFAY